MRKILTLILVVVALLAITALAAGPYTHSLASNTGSQFIALVDSLSYSYPEDPALYFPDADVTVSYWNYTTQHGWVRLNNDGGGNAFADSVSTIPAGTVERPDFNFKAVFVTRATATSGVIKWFK